MIDEARFKKLNIYGLAQYEKSGRGREKVAQK
jgi:hypothetical protein